MTDLKKFHPTGSLSGSRLRAAWFAALAMGVILGGASPAHSLDDAAEAVPASGTQAARLSNVEGSVRVVQDGQILADPAAANMPLFQGSEVATGNDGRAEIQLEDGSLARLSPNSTLTFSVLQQQGTSTRTEVALVNGLAYFELQPSTAEHSLRVTYGSASFSASSFSVVRILMDAAPGSLAVFSGNLHLERGDALQLDLHGGESLSLDAADATHYNLSETIEPDSWDSWNADRDQTLSSESGERTAATNSYANAAGLGMGELDANGSWYDVPGQGYVWSPFDAQSQGAGWDPYGFGQWTYYPSYGYVWVSGYGWGYAPYQCGLWNFYDNFGWGWAPGMGCNPWWQYGGWGYTLGNRPGGYLPPRRPLPGPGHPHPVGKHPLLQASTIRVDRRSAGPVDLSVYARPTRPVQIGGHTVEPLRPLTPRPVYAREQQQGNRPAGGYSAGYYSSGAGAGGAGAHPVYHAPAAGRPAGSSRPAASAPASHPSYSGGGGGGGGGHPAGGGGGGGTHK